MYLGQLFPLDKLIFSSLRRQDTKSQEGHLTRIYLFFSVLLIHGIIEMCIYFTFAAHPQTDRNFQNLKHIKRMFNLI